MNYIRDVCLHVFGRSGPQNNAPPPKNGKLLLKVQNQLSMWSQISCFLTNVSPGPSGSLQHHGAPRRAVSVRGGRQEAVPHRHPHETGRRAELGRPGRQESDHGDGWWWQINQPPHADLCLTQMCLSDEAPSSLCGFPLHYFGYSLYLFMWKVTGLFVLLCLL